MLPQGEKLKERAHLRTLPELNPPITVRLKFRKVGSLQYISHLDLQRTFLRVLVRACIPVWYTKGFNPHPKLVFSAPLSVGAQSVYEFLDIRIDRAMEPSEIKERLNRELTEELFIEDAYLPTSDFSQIGWASYEIKLCSCGMNAEKAEELKQTLTASPLMMTKRTKSGEKEVDIIPLIRSAESVFDEVTGQITLTAVLRASSSEYLNPELLVTALKDHCGILCGDPMNEWYSILRTSVMKEDGTLFA
ncbi:MAG: DUF2344 domain-containing protein [Ruminococcaceae bacterium]|nr:DUF2344 domain-containing protein [Oscillospiraceae bacterium]